MHIDDVSCWERWRLLLVQYISLDESERVDCGGERWIQRCSYDRTKGCTDERHWLVSYAVNESMTCATSIENDAASWHDILFHIKPYFFITTRHDIIQHDAAGADVGAGVDAGAGVGGRSAVQLVQGKDEAFASGGEAGRVHLDRIRSKDKDKDKYKTVSHPGWDTDYSRAKGDTEV